jgi:regulator of replication initiation timing
MAETITLEFLAEQQKQLLTEVRSMREDLDVTSATVRRMDGTLQGLVSEIRALAAQQSRLRLKVDSHD